jgi:hypothetical protein
MGYVTRIEETRNSYNILTREAECKILLFKT